MTNQPSTNETITAQGIVRSKLAKEVQAQVEKGLMPITIIPQGTKRMSEIVHPEGWPMAFENAWKEEVYAVVFAIEMQPTGPSLSFKVYTVAQDKRAELVNSDELKDYSLIKELPCGEQTRDVINDFDGLKVAGKITEKVDLLVYGKYC